jgi:predicted hydrocarbon binding protein
MPEVITPHLAVPNRFGWIYLTALEEILGTSGLIAVLNQAGERETIGNFPANDMTPLENPGLFSRTGKALEGLYGVRGGRGLAMRTGRASFKYYLQYFGQEMGVETVDFRLLPMEQKVFSGLQALAAMIADHSGQEIQVEKEPQYYFWKSSGCPYCWGREAASPVCHFQVGLLQSALYWLSGGKYYTVQETACAAQGEAVEIIRIDRNPLD